MNNDLRSITEIINETVVYIRQGQAGYSAATLNKTFRKLEEIALSLPESQVEQLAPILRVMLDAQQRRDMIFLADILQYEVTKILKNQ
ncbi:hypothetical protein [uncultured Pseudoalteromonas sp.]|mgnify:FL=1|uniref:hypothetical protein n=1 Tax=uncultured Pseudoalteromonas sp. TaxID=114053 RepID=UPI0030D7CC1F|tara:strand:- start:4316 stop:4579 length:264 start_codon:yes stop_codon:yes gene_type:complete